MRSKLNVLLGTIISLGVIYGMYWIVKSVSYWLFYEDMTRSTIVEMVKQTALR